MSGLVGKLVAAGVAGAGAALVARRIGATLPGGKERWERKNFRGSTVTLAGGPAVAAGAAAGIALAPGLPARARTAGVAAAVTVGAVGLYDDFAPVLEGTTCLGRFAGTTSSKGLRGHLSALREGEVTSGVVKIGVIGAAGLVGAALVSDNAVDAAIGGAAVAGHANLLNLLDLRPGRANKAVLLHTPAVLAGPAAPLGAAAVGAALASLPDDLGERIMLGDSGANALGALLGLALIAREGRLGRLAHLAAVTGLTLASEKVSFTKVIESTPVLRELDGLGRLR
ncbi:hypothetical protein [Jiangella asiatica]|uniref:Glycosyl transferase family 4 n=1 Tax=Jiangella asiatica TaxID=2530372 RepID=A0A4R5CKH7_9ACTN|nr:hypothetical protein [Jiangella asiatica]TDD99120.1 hypothetical protein E1269_27305 [Jiangella asiatica]